MKDEFVMNNSYQNNLISFDRIISFSDQGAIIDLRSQKSLLNDILLHKMVKMLDDATVGWTHLSLNDCMLSVLINIALQLGGKY